MVSQIECIDIQDPSAEAVTQIVDALQTINRSAAKEFVRLYLGNIVELEDAADSASS